MKLRELHESALSNMKAAHADLVEAAEKIKKWMLQSMEKKDWDLEGIKDKEVHVYHDVDYGFLIGHVTWRGKDDPEHIEHSYTAVFNLDGTLSADTSHGYDPPHGLEKVI